MTGFAFLSTIADWLRGLGLPLGVVVIGLVIGALVYGALDWLRRRPWTTFAGTVSVRVVEPWNEAGTSDGDRSSTEAATHVVSVPVYDSDGQRTVRMVGAGEHPSMPLPRALRFVVTLLLTFVTIAVLLLLFYPLLFSRYDNLVALAGSVLYWPQPWPGVYAVGTGTLVVPDYIFPMYLAGMAAFAVASGLIYRRPPFPAYRRLTALALVLGYVCAELIIDALFFTVPGATLRSFALIARAFTGGFFLATLSLCPLYLPTPQRIHPRLARNRGIIVRFFAVACISIAVAVTALLTVTMVLHEDGLVLGFTILLLLPLLTLETFALISRTLYFRDLRRRSFPSVAVYHPSVSILMPAYNEEEWISEAILHADRAAANYPGPVEIVVGNDGSNDRTLELARAAIAQLQHCRGQVVDLPHGGKSNALNGALAMATGEIVIRCDGDTYISEEPGFADLIPHFSDPEVGGVQGAIHPRQTTGWTRKLRALEVAWNHYLLRPGTMGVRSAEVIDGLFSAFRREDLVALGGWVPWNGEDTEIAIRVQRLGFKIRIEPRALAFEDVPENYDGLRRQRVRWARGILMANGQHFQALVGDTPEYAGLAVLFWFLLFVRSGVRSLVYVFLALLILILGVPALLFTAVLFLLAIGLRAGPLGYFLVKMKRKDVLLWIPFFPIGNIIKQNFRFEAFGLLGPDARREYV